MNQTDARTFPARFTQAQRKAVAELLPELTDRLDLEKQNRTVRFTLNELRTIQGKAREALPHAENGMKRNSLRHIVETTTKTIEDAQGIGAIPASQRLYQFKITLLGSEPPIWRRIQVKDGTLDKLHEHIQTAMGWTNSHLHEFEIDGDRYGDPDLLQGGFEDFPTLDSTVTRISEVVPRSGSRFRFLYRYDFGDDWEHEVLFEGCLRAEPGGRSPRCIEGERACPPEDVGGLRGYADYLEALSDPDHEQHEDSLRWRGPFDPEAFDPVRATKHMRRGLPDWRQWARDDRLPVDREPESVPRDDDLLEEALAVLDDIRWAYKQHETHRPVVLFDLQEHRIYVYPYREFKDELNERSQTFLESQYTKAQQKNQMVVFVRDNEGRRFVSYSFDVG